MKLTVTVGIPAYNEEANIENILSAIVTQKKESFILEKIIVFSDGCTDQTETKVRAFAERFPIIKVDAEKKRHGKVFLLNKFFQLNNSDICITFDGDIMLGSETTIEEMVRIFLNNKKVVMVAAHQIPIRPDTFAGKVIYAGYQFWDSARLSVKNYDHIQNHYGAATAMLGSLAKKIYIPLDITDDRGYLYIRAKQFGDFVYTKRAVIYYRPVSTLRDFIKLGDRSFLKNQKILANHFSDTVYDMYHIPAKYKIKGITLTFIKSPLYTIIALFLNAYIRFFPSHDALYDSGMWEISESTKKPITLKK